MMEEHMGKYAPLKTFLLEQGPDRIPMTFKEIEKLLNVSLPASKRYPAWWSNNPSNNTMTREWLEAGFETEAVDTQSEKLVFRRVRKPPPMASAEGGGVRSSEAVPLRHHPIFGCMKGTLTILPGVDLTEPADPEWGHVYED
jgi:hypothetical protein